MSEVSNAYKTVVRKKEKRDHLRNIGIDGMIILK
jgi:hypothetical protein